MADDIEQGFPAFPKIPRLNRPVTVTEKIDGTNALVHIDLEGRVRAGSRNRWITPEQDNFGFARWVAERAEQMVLRLGFGTHYGEWWGAGVGRRYDMKEKVWSLFNSKRWGSSELPDGVRVVSEAESEET